MRVFRLSVPLLGLLAATAPASAGVPTYTTFELQARAALGGGFNLPTGSSFNSVTPALNDDGVVAFKLVIAGDTGNAGVWYGGGGAGSVVYDAPSGRQVGDVSVNGAGDVAFHRSFDFVSEGVWRYDPTGDTTTQVVPPGGPLGIQWFSDPVIDDTGAIGARVDLGATQAFLTDDAGVQTVYVEEGTGGIAFLFVAEYNDAGQLAGKVRLGGLSNDQPDEIRRYEPDGTFTTMAVDADSDGASPFLGFGNGIGLSDAGLVAFNATIAGGDGVFLSDGTTTTTIATSADPEIDSIDFFWPAVNDDGLVVFRAFEPGGTRAIFAGDGTTLRRVVGEHDIVPIDLGDARIDRPDDSPTFGGNPGVNAEGDVIFSATLTAPGDPQTSYGSGIFVAYAGSTVGAAEDPAPAPRARVRVSPNPFRAAARIDLSLSGAPQVALGIYAADGRRVRHLALGAAPAGHRVVTWDGTDDHGRQVAPGTYFLRIETPGGVLGTRRITRLR